jgi:hypothetical protein
MRNGDSSGSRLSKKVHLSKGFFCVILSQKINKKITSMAANKLLPEKVIFLFQLVFDDCTEMKERKFRLIATNTNINQKKINNNSRCLCFISLCLKNPRFFFFQETKLAINLHLVDLH